MPLSLSLLLLASPCFSASSTLFIFAYQLQVMVVVSLFTEPPKFSQISKNVYTWPASCKICVYDKEENEQSGEDEANGTTYTGVGEDEGRGREEVVETESSEDGIRNRKHLEVPTKQDEEEGERRSEGEGDDEKRDQEPGVPIEFGRESTPPDVCSCECRSSTVWMLLRVLSLVLFVTTTGLTIYFMLPVE
jgi:hypothetical protein